MLNNAIYDSSGRETGFVCRECDEVKSKMWGNICNQCREAERRHQETLRAIGNKKGS